MTHPDHPEHPAGDPSRDEPAPARGDPASPAPAPGRGEPPPAGEGLSRRQFLRWAGLAGGYWVAASAGLTAWLARPRPAGAAGGRPAGPAAAGSAGSTGEGGTAEAGPAWEVTPGLGEPARGRLQADVVVIGAGFAGLAAARDLARAGRDVLLLEARRRVGGRVLNHPLGSGKVVEVGGQWVGPTQDRILAMAKEVGVGTFPTYNTGQYVDYRNGRLTRYDGRIPTSDPAAYAEAAAALALLDRMAWQVPLDKPWTAPRAREWDGQTFATWMRDHLATPGGRELVRLAIQAVFACEPEDVSLLHVLFYVHSAGSLERLVNTAGGAQERRFVGGSQRVAERVAQRLGRRVRPASPVQRIRQGRWGVAVEGEGFRVEARRVIVAMAPTLTGRLQYDPPLPGWRDQLTQRVPQGSVIKVQCVYDRPFWRDDGLAGQATSDTGPVKVTFDNSPPDGRPGVLLGFIEGDDARVAARWDARTRRRRVIECFVRYFGPKAALVRQYIERDWSQDPWTRGCYAGYFPPGVWTAYGHALREPIGRIHWAGTETALIWNGYFDGAVRSGEDAARAVLRLRD